MSFIASFIITIVVIYSALRKRQTYAKNQLRELIQNLIIMLLISHEPY